MHKLHIRKKSKHPRKADTTYIYILKKSNQVIYVGCTTMPDARIVAHRGRFGEDVVLEVIEEYRVDEYKKLTICPEEFWIHQFWAWGFKLENIRDTPPKSKQTPFTLPPKPKVVEKVPKNFIEYLREQKKVKEYL